MLEHAQRWPGTGFVPGTIRPDTGFIVRDKTHLLYIQTVIYGVTPRLEIYMSQPRQYVTLEHTKQRKYDTANIYYSVISLYYATTVQHI